MEQKDIDLQIAELKRLIASIKDGNRKKSIEDQIEALEKRKQSLMKHMKTSQPILLKKFRPPSARNRKSLLVTVKEDNPVSQRHLTTELDKRTLSNVIEICNSWIYDIISPSNDARYPPSNAIDGKLSTFWISTGMYPQLLIVTLCHTVYLDSIQITCSNVRKIRVVCQHSKAVINPDPIVEEFNRGGGPDHPIDENRIEPRLKHFHFDGDAIDSITLEILNGFDDFCMMYNIKIYGEERSSYE